MPHDSEATRSRLIGAAVAEFADRGLAGARVDRIAIYDYFDNKEGLFDTALTRVIGDLIEAVPLHEDDLPSYAGRLFDYLLAHPEAVRMISWRRLERPHAGPRIADTFIEHMTAVRDQTDTTGTEHTIAPVDLVILVIGLANAWQLSSTDLLAAARQDPSDPDRAAVHRAAVVEAARRISNAS